jgi:hypothetical protein
VLDRTALARLIFDDYGPGKANCTPTQKRSIGKIERIFRAFLPRTMIRLCSSGTPAPCFANLLGRIAKRGLERKVAHDRLFDPWAYISGSRAAESLRENAGNSKNFVS